MFGGETGNKNTGLRVHRLETGAEAGPREAEVGRLGKDEAAFREQEGRIHRKAQDPKGGHLRAKVQGDNGAVSEEQTGKGREEERGEQSRGRRCPAPPLPSPPLPQGPRAPRRTRVLETTRLTPVWHALGNNTRWEQVAPK